MALEHLIVHKSSDYLCAFPDIIRLHNGDLVTVFRESPIHPPNRNPERPQDAKITHHHVITGSRVALVRSTDDGGTWDPDSRIVIDPGNDAQDLNMPLIAQLSSGELIVVNHRWFVNLTEAQLAALRGKRNIRIGSSSAVSNYVFDSLYFIRSSDQGFTWERAATGEGVTALWSVHRQDGDPGNAGRDLADAAVRAGAGRWDRPDVH